MDTTLQSASDHEGSAQRLRVDEIEGIEDAVSLHSTEATMIRVWRLAVLAALGFTAALGFALASPAQTMAQSFGSGRSTTNSSSTSGMFGPTTFGSSAGQSGTSSNSNSSNTQSASSAQSPLGSQLTSGQGLRGTVERQAFIGASSENITNVRSLQDVQGANRLGLNARGGLNSLGGLQNLFSQQGLFNQNGQQGQGQARSPLTIPIRLGFPNRPVIAAQFTPRFQQRLAKLPGLKALGPIEVTMEGRTAVLRGTVASEADRELAAGLAKLEPEVLEVQNELVVGSAETTAEESSPEPPSN